MAGDPEPKVDFAKLRERFTEQTLIEPQQFLAHIESDSNHVYVHPLKIGEKDYGIIRFRRWSHEETNRFQYLPYLPKLLSGEALTPAEETEYLTFQAEMVVDALIDKTRWFHLLSEDEEFVRSVFNLISYVSGVHSEFDREMDDFVDSNLGYAYGLVWFQMMRRTPSEIAKLPETDVKTVNAWIIRWMERMQKDGS